MHESNGGGVGDSGSGTVLQKLGNFSGVSWLIRPHYNMPSVGGSVRSKLT